MNIQSLRYFVAIAEGCTVSHVADQFYITQPALSRSIQRLENELNCKLFDRSASSLQLTKQGKAALPIVKQILSLTGDLLELIEDHNCGHRGCLTIGCCGIEGTLLYEIVSLIHRSYPLMNIETPGPFSVADMVNKLINKEIDCCFLYSGYHYSNGDVLESFPLCKARMQLLVPSDHPFASLHTVSIEQLAEQHLLLYNKESFPDFHDRFLDSCYSWGVKPCVSDTFASVQELFSKEATGKGLGVIHATDTCRYENAAFSYIDLVDPRGHPFYKGYLSFFWNRHSNNPALPLTTTILQEIFPSNSIQ